MSNIEILYNHSEILTIPQELFTKESGIIQFCICSANERENENFRIIAASAIYYQKEGNKIILSSEDFSQPSFVEQIIKEIKMFLGISDK